MLRRSWMVGVCVLAMNAAACSAASSDYMRPAVAPAPLKAETDKAVVVFVRPSSLGGGLTPTVLDSRGRFIGESVAESHFAVTMPPGEHMFVVWAENTGSLKANLEAGKIYFVEVSLSMGAFSAQADLVAIKPNTASWQELDAWLAETTLHTPDEPRGQAYLATRKEDVAERIQRAKENYAGYDAEELVEHTLAVADGR